VINSFLVYESKNNNAKNPHHKTVDLSSSVNPLIDIELIKIFEKSIAEDCPYLVQLDNSNWSAWVKRRRKYWEEEKMVSVTYHHLSRSVYVVPMR
jgi:hypothetical protein